MSNELYCHHTASLFIDTSTLIELPEIPSRLKTKLGVKKWQEINEVIIPSTVISEVRRHIQLTIDALDDIIDSIGADKYRIRNILRKCPLHVPNILMCKELLLYASILDSNKLKSINYTMSLIKIINDYCRGMRGKKCIIINSYISRIKTHANKLTKANVRTASSGLIRFFIDLIKDFRPLLSMILLNLEDIVADICIFFIGVPHVDIVESDKCSGFKDNDMIIYCQALVYSSEKLSQVLLVTKDRDFRNKENTWKQVIANQLHLSSHNVKVIRL